MVIDAMLICHGKCDAKRKVLTASSSSRGFPPFRSGSARIIVVAAATIVIAAVSIVYHRPCLIVFPQGTEIRRQ